MTDASLEDKRRADIRDAWKLPLVIAWVGILTVSYFLDQYWCPVRFNPHSFDTRVHQVVMKNGEIENEPWPDDDGFVYASRWRDPRSGEIYSPSHPDVVGGVRAEKQARAVVTFMLGLPMVYIYRLRERAMGASGANLSPSWRNGLLLCFVCGCISYFIPVVDLLRAVIGGRDARIG
jgi:hypothetical protein